MQLEISFSARVDMLCNILFTVISLSSEIATRCDRFTEI